MKLSGHPKKRDNWKYVLLISALIYYLIVNSLGIISNTTGMGVLIFIVIGALTVILGRRVDVIKENRDKINNEIQKNLSQQYSSKIAMISLLPVSNVQIEEIDKKINELSNFKEDFEESENIFKAGLWNSVIAGVVLTILFTFILEIISNTTYFNSSQGLGIIVSLSPFLLLLVVAFSFFLFNSISKFIMIDKMANVVVKTTHHTNPEPLISILPKFYKSIWFR